MERAERDAKEKELRDRVAKGDLEAMDQLAHLLFNGSGEREEVADLIVAAWRRGYYEDKPHSNSGQLLFGMVDSRLIPYDSPAAQYVRERRELRASVSSRAHSAAGKAGIAVFIGYFVLIFVGGVTGFLRDFSLIIAGGLAWGAWTLVLNSF